MAWYNIFAWFRKEEIKLKCDYGKCSTEINGEMAVAYDSNSKEIFHLGCVVNAALERYGPYKVQNSKLNIGTIPIEEARYLHKNKKLKQSLDDKARRPE